MRRRASWGATIDGSPAVGNFDDDSDLEIVIAKPSANAGYNFSSGKFVNEGKIYVYNMDGALVSGWPKTLPGEPFSSPVVGDINNGGNEDIIIGLMYADDFNTSYGGLYAFDKNGNILSGWPVENGYQFWSTPSLGDIDGDGNLEILASTTFHQTYLFNFDGSIVSGWPRTTFRTNYYGTAITDVDGDSSLDLLVSAGSIYDCIIYNNCGGVYAWDNNGNLLEGFPKITEVDAQAPATIDDIDDDGLLELIASSTWDRSLEATKNRGSIYVWDLDTPYDPSTMEWPQYQHDIWHTGRYLTETLNSGTKLKAQSKVVNSINNSLSGELMMKLQKQNSEGL